jgi:hypothetical protein
MPNDRGPIYLETLMGRFPVEPWNTYSNLLFLALIVFWFFRVRRDVRDHRFIAYSLPVFVLGWAGGTVYHATRSHNVWLFLDFGPIALLAFAAAIFFWRRQRAPWLVAPLLVIGPVAAIGFAASTLDGFRAGPWLGFSTLALSILMPVLVNLARTRWKDFALVAGALVGFAVAVTFRSIDLRVPIAFLPMGTHWLWHSFGAVAVHLLMLYIYRGDQRLAAGLVDRRAGAGALAHT